VIGGSAADLVAGSANLNLRQEGVCFDFPNLAKIDVLLTYTCNASCEHCITRSNPRRTEKLPEEMVRSLLSAGIDAGKRYMSFTGGEPFLDFPLLLRLVRHARDLGYYVGVDTNAFWGVSDRKARDWAARLRDAGIDAVFPSADAYHLPYVPVERVRRVVDACEEIGIICEVNFCPGPDPEVNDWILRFMGLVERGFFNDGLSLTGNDVSHLQHLFPYVTAAEMDDIGSMHMGVSAVGEVYANVDISDGGEEYRGTPFVLGDLRDDEPAVPLRREREQPLLSVARTQGPAQVDAYLRRQPGLADRYAAGPGRASYYSPTEYFLALFHGPDAGRYAATLTAWGAELAAEEEHAADAISVADVRAAQR
jgi:hypothetical protein